MRLTNREIAIISAGGFLLAVAAFWAWVIDPIHESMALLDRQVVYNIKRHDELINLSKRHSVLKAKVQAIEAKISRSKDFSILSYLETQATKMDLKKNIVQMKPKSAQSLHLYKQSSVEIRMERVTLDRLVDYLYEVENSPDLLRIDDLKIKPRFDNKSLVDARFTVSAYELTENI